MPELPEVESLRLSLEKRILNSKILDIKILKPKIVSSKSSIRKVNTKKVQEFEKIKNKKIISLTRLAKNLIINLSDNSVLIVHLKMTGQLVFQDKNKEKTYGGHPIIKSIVDDLPNKHTAIIFTLDNGILFYNDVRMFGYVLYYKNLKEAKSNNHFQNTSLEPFDKDFTYKYLKESLSNKNKNIKSILLDQSIVNGCGNIYADEICFASKILPTRVAKSLKDTEIKLLHKNIIKILSLAIEHGGSSVSDYLLADGSRGNYTRLHKVYGRANQECKICKNTLLKEKVAGRTTVYCKVCQK